MIEMMIAAWNQRTTIGMDVFFKEGVSIVVLELEWSI